MLFSANSNERMKDNECILQKLWRRARVIPGKYALIKRPELYLKRLTYFSKSKGCSIWDLDSNHYLT